MRRFVLLAAVPALAVASCAAIKDDPKPIMIRPTSQPAVAPASTRPADRESVCSTQAVSVEVTIEEAVLQALENNRALRVERLNPPIARTFVQQELAAFEPVLVGEIAGGRERVFDREGESVRDSVVTGRAAIAEFLPTGTTIDAGIDTDRRWSTLLDDFHAVRAGVTVTQALLEGAGVAVNLADLRQAKVDVKVSEYEFRGFAEALVAEVETTYWDYVLARRQVRIVEDSLALAQQQLDETQHRIRVGDLAETELAAAEAEVALRREALINARSLADAVRVRLLRLIRPDAMPATGCQIIPHTEPTVPPIPLESLEDHMAVALHLRPEIRQAQLLVRRDQLEIVKTRNGLLPRLDLFVTLGRTGYAESFGDALRDLDTQGYDALVGVRFEHPVTNLADRAQHRRAVLSLEQQEESLRNLEDLVRQDVALAFIEVRRTREQVDATATTRRFQEEKLRAETVKFRVGKSTAILVAAAQRDLVASQVAEVQAVANYLKARTQLYRLEGSLLERRGLSAPGRQAMIDIPRVPASPSPSEIR